MKVWIEVETLRPLVVAVSREHNPQRPVESPVERMLRRAREHRALVDAIELLFMTYDRPDPLQVNKRHTSGFDSKAAIQRVKEMLQGRVLAGSAHPRTHPA